MFTPVTPALVPLFVALLSTVPPVVARRAPGPIHVDGRLDDAAWRAAEPFSSFVESFPNEGAPASMPTEARVLYDDRFLYIGVLCHDPHPELIARQLGRRDSALPSDLVEIAIDSNRDGRTAYDFSVNAAGALRDQLLFADFNATDSWDAVWDGAAEILPDGWSMEIAIPLRTLRFSAQHEQTWTIEIRRVVPRTHQVFDSAMIPRTANAQNLGGMVVSRFGTLIGLRDLKRRHDIEPQPYLAARLSERPQYSDPSTPHPRLLDPSIDVGLDFKTPLTSDLTLTGAINPDFGQVEADSVIQNLSTAEPFFPEKRPFFLEGLDIFQSVGAEYGSVQRIFYSRRVGLDAPMLAALKVTGSARPGLDVGLLESLVMGAGNPSMAPIGYESPTAAQLAPYEATPDRRWQFHLTQPFHFGPNDALPIAHPVSTNYLAAIARQRFGNGSSAGGFFTSVVPLEARCERSEFASDADFLAAGCSSLGGNALGADLDLKDKSGEWRAFGQVEGTQQVGGDPAGRVLRDGTIMKPGDLGLGGHLRAGKLSGDPFRFDVVYVCQDAKLDLNQLGFSPSRTTSGRISTCTT